MKIQDRNKNRAADLQTISACETRCKTTCKQIGGKPAKETAKETANKAAGVLPLIRQNARRFLHKVLPAACSFYIELYRSASASIGRLSENACVYAQKIAACTRSMGSCLLLLLHGHGAEPRSRPPLQNAGDHSRVQAQGLLARPRLQKRFERKRVQWDWLRQGWFQYWF